MRHLKLSILVILGISVVGVTGVYQFSSAETDSHFICKPNAENGHVICSTQPRLGDHGLFAMDSKNRCPIDVIFIIQNQMVVEFRESPDCKFNDGFTLSLTLD